MSEVSNQAPPATPAPRRHFIKLASRCFHGARNLNFTLERTYAMATLKAIENELVALDTRISLAKMKEILA